MLLEYSAFSHFNLECIQEVESSQILLPPIKSQVPLLQNNPPPPSKVIYNLFAKAEGKNWPSLTGFW